jgi:DNA-binding MltR family transcriptional regulator
METLAELSRKPIGPDVIKDVLQQLNSDNPRVAAIVGGTLLDNCLDNVLLSRFIKLTPAEHDKLLGNEGIVGTFGTKIDMSHALGAIDAKTRDDLHSIRKIRNAFAHGAEALSFDAPAIAAECSRLRTIANICKPSVSASKKFAIAVGLLAVHLLDDSIEHERLAPKR